MLRRKVLVAASWLLLGSAANASQPEPLVFLGDRDLPPYEFLEGDEPRGANVDLARAIGRVLGRPVEIRLMDWAEAQARLRAGEGHALTMFGQTDERDTTHDFTQTTFPATFALFVRADEAAGFAAGTRLEGRRVGATRGGLPREHIAANHPEATLLLVDDLVQGTRMLLRGEIDALAANAWAERYLLRDLNVTGVAELPAFARRTGNIAVRNGESALLAEIDRALSVLKASGEFDAIIDRWSRERVHLLPDWVVRSAAAGGAAALVGLAALSLLSWRLRAGKQVLAREVVERARAEEALRASEQRLRTIFSSIDEGFCLCEMVVDQAGRGVDYRFLEVNPLFEAMTGLKDAVGRTVLELIPDLERLWVETYARVALGGETLRFEQGSEATGRWYDVFATPVQPSGRFAIVFKDVTDRRQAEHALVESEAQLRGVLDNLFAFVGVLSPDGTLIKANRLPLRAAGLTIEDVLGRPFWECHWWSHDPALQAWLRDACERALAGEVTRADAVVRMAGDSRRIIDFQIAPLRNTEGRVTHLIPSAVDVTERRAAEAALAASEERLTLASAAAGMGVWDLDAEAGTAVVNAEFRALYGLAPGDAPVSFREVIGRVHSEDRERVLLGARATLSDGGRYRDEFRIKRADTGEERWVASRGRGVEVGPRPRRLIGVSYDVTGRRAAQDRQTLLALEVDHRAKNVLAVVTSIVRLTRAEDSGQFAEAVEGRVAALARAHTLLASDRWTGASLAETVHAELDAYEGAGRVMVKGPPLRLQPDSVQPMSMVLHELATNAAKYGALSLPGGRVDVSWHLDAQGSDGDGPATILRLTWTERGGPALLRPPERLGFGSILIEATVKSQFDGTAGMHWDVEGLRCEIAVPANRLLAATAPDSKQKAKVPRVAFAATNLGSVSLRGRRVLVVDDEQLIALELAATLADLGCEVIGPAGTLEEALRLAVEQAGRLDAAVLDVNLQGRQSFPVADALSVFGVPVIYVTGYGSMPSGRSAEASPLLGKPLRPGHLAAALRRVLASREAAASPPVEQVSAERQARTG